MAKLVDLTKKPYNLSAEQIKWVEDTIKNMSDREKIGQLFFNLFFFGKDTFSGGELTNKEIIEKYHIGGARYHGGDKKKIQELLNSLQEYSKIPLLVAANCDSGGNGATPDGTYIASAAQIGASKSEKMAFDAGLVSARESAALGVSINFDPCVDIIYNWRNTIVNTRSYGDNPDDVIKYSSAFIDGFRSEKDMIVCVKHWPGDGVEERDQHLVLGVNEQSIKEWDESYGKVYKHHIDKGAEMIMAAHFVVPKYQKALVPGIKEKDMLPASISYELTQVLLKEKLDFNGMVVTDASHMIGLTCMMQRKDYVPKTIAAGCDMFLFFNNMEEDFNYMYDGYKNGIITQERLHDALRRILGLKAKLNLNKKKEDGSIIVSNKELDNVGSKENLDLRKKAANDGITLVKDTQKLLPISTSTHKRICLFYLESASPGIVEPDKTVVDNFSKILRDKGFEVTLFPANSRVKGSIEEFKSKYDLVITLLNIVGYAAENNYRVSYPAPMSVAAPWYIHEVPTIVVSLNYTTHLHDYSAAKTYINAYHENVDNMQALVEKLLGESKFNHGFTQSVWTDKWEAKI